MELDEQRLYTRLGAELRRQREHLGISQARLAEAAGLRRTSVVNIEAGRQRLPLHVLYALCDELGVEAGEVLPLLADLRLSGDSVDTEIVVEGQVHRVTAKTAGFVRLFQEKPNETDDDKA